MKYRHELKFYASEATLELLRTRISHVVKRDEHQVDTNGYLITSLYFDDIYDHCAKETIGGYDRRHKYRLRIYGHNSDVIKLERKSKIHGMTAKTSAQVTVEECNQMMSGTIPRLCTEYSEQKNQILTEMKINGMRPKCVVQYQREAFVHQIGNVRITFDKNVEGSKEIRTFLDERINMVPILNTGMHILEVKYDNLLPRYISDALEIEKLMQTSFSKYGQVRSVLG